MALNDKFLYFGRTNTVLLRRCQGNEKLVEVGKWEITKTNQKLVAPTFPFSSEVELAHKWIEVEEGSRLAFAQVPADEFEAVKEENIEIESKTACSSNETLNTGITIDSSSRKDGSVSQSSEQVSPNSAKSCLPSFFSPPLVKATCSDLDKSSLERVYVSGMRSAIKDIEDELYRFKGVGNGIINSEIQTAFPVRIVGQDHLRPTLDPNSPTYDALKQSTIEIRGGMFSFTVSREQALTSIINKHLLSQNVPVANEPMGYYQYSSFEVRDLQKTFSREVSICCGLYRTYGDKRLASHLLWGLELLIPHIFDATCLTRPASQLIPALSNPTPSQSEPAPELNPTFAQNSNSETTSTTEGTEASAPPTAPSEPSWSSWIEKLFAKDRKTFFPKEDAVEVMDTGFSALEGNALLLSLMDSFIDPSYLLKHEAPPCIPENVDQIAWKDVWNAEWTILLKSMKEVSDGDNLGYLFARMYWSIGWQVGTILREIHAANVNWGTYDDLLGNHCNSHPNNLVVLKKEDVSHQLDLAKSDQAGNLKNNEMDFFLGPLDFDLAFTKETFIVNSGIDKDERWNELKEMEVSAMKLALGGLNINSGVEGRAELPLQFEPIRIALRDTLVLSFCEAYYQTSFSESKPLTDAITQGDLGSTVSESERPSLEQLRKIQQERLQKNSDLLHSLSKLALVLSENNVA